METIDQLVFLWYSRVGPDETVLWECNQFGSCMRRHWESSVFSWLVEIILVGYSRWFYRIQVLKPWGQMHYLNSSWFSQYRILSVDNASLTSSVLNHFVLSRQLIEPMVIIKSLPPPKYLQFACKATSMCDHYIRTHYNNSPLPTSANK